MVRLPPRRRPRAAPAPIVGAVALALVLLAAAPLRADAPPAPGPRQAAPPRLAEARLDRVADDVAADAAMEALLAPYRERVAELLRPVGHVAVAMPKDDDPPLLGAWMADAMRTAAAEAIGAPVDLAFTNRGGIRASLPAGEVSFDTLLQIMPFDNRIVVFELDGAQMEQMCRFLAAGRGYFPISGARLAFTRDGELREAEVGGAPIDPARRYRVATSDYLADLNDGVRLPEGLAAPVRTDILHREALVADVRRAAGRGEALQPPADPDRLFVADRLPPRPAATPVPDSASDADAERAFLAAAARDHLVLVAAPVAARAPGAPLAALAADLLLEELRVHRADGSLAADGALLNSGVGRGTLRAGPARRDDILRVFQWRNAVALVTLRGFELMTIVERAAAARGTFTLAGLRATLDADGRLAALATADGNPVDPMGTYRLATTDFVHRAGAGADPFAGMPAPTLLPLTLPEAVSRAAARRGDAGIPLAPPSDLPRLGAGDAPAPAHSTDAPHPTSSTATHDAASAPDADGPDDVPASSPAPTTGAPR